MGLLPAKRFAITVCIAAICLSGCLVRNRLVTRQGKRDNRPLLTATRDELVERIRGISSPVQSFSATLDMTPSVGSVNQGDISEFPSVRGYVFFRRADDIRIIGLDPVIHSRAFDMVSTGLNFKLSIPSKNRFIVGRNDAPTNSKNKLENLRPSAFIEAMIVRPPDPTMEFPVLEDDTDEEHAQYILLILNRQNDQIRVVRSVYFDRLTLQIVRQKSFDLSGATTSDTRYKNWKLYGGVSFPASIDINRPRDGYGVVMNLMKMEMNVTLTPDKFELAQPEGTQLKTIGVQ